MERESSVWVRNASTKALYPISGMLAGLLGGLIRARLGFTDELTQLALVAHGGFAGFLLGAAAALASMLWLGRASVTSLRGLMLAVSIAALTMGFLSTTLFRFLTSPG
jgi:hypothetical protein